MKHNQRQLEKKMNRTELIDTHRERTVERRMWKIKSKWNEVEKNKQKMPHKEHCTAYMHITQHANNKKEIVAHFCLCFCFSSCLFMVFILARSSITNRNICAKVHQVQACMCMCTQNNTLIYLVSTAMPNGMTARWNVHWNGNDESKMVFICC